jgi:hypothetical protein
VYDRDPTGFGFASIFALVFLLLVFLRLRFCRNEYNTATGVNNPSLFLGVRKVEIEFDTPQRSPFDSRYYNRARVNGLIGLAAAFGWASAFINFAALGLFVLILRVAAGFQAKWVKQIYRIPEHVTIQVR